MSKSKFGRRAHPQERSRRALLAQQHHAATPQQPKVKVPLVPPPEPEVLKKMAAAKPEELVAKPVYTLPTPTPAPAVTPAPASIPPSPSLVASAGADGSSGAAPEEKKEGEEIKAKAEGEKKVSGGKKKKQSAREQLVVLFDDLESALQENMRDARVKGIRNHNLNISQWRKLLGTTRKIRTLSMRHIKSPKSTTRPNNSSGFKIPIRVSAELMEFAGWDASEPHSRVDVTNMIHKYIADNNLQNPKNRKEILPDPKLYKLLKYSTIQPDGSDAAPLTYFTIQRHIQQHLK